jgi:MFS family permease
MATPIKLTLEEAINRLGVGPFQHRIMAACGFCNAADAMEVLLLSFLGVVVQQEFDLGPHYGSLLTSIVFLGAMMGTLLLGAWGDRLGRKPTFLLACAIIATSGLLTAAAQNYWQMLLLRFGVGFGLGGIVIVYDSMSEFLPSDHRGTHMMRLGYFWTIGTMGVPLMAYLGLQQENSWRIFVLLCSIPCLLSSLFAFLWGEFVTVTQTLFFMDSHQPTTLSYYLPTLSTVPESPRWLVSQGKADKALEILRHGALLNGKDPAELFPEGIHFIRDPLEEEDQVHSISHLFENEWRKLTLFLWAVWIGKSFMYWYVRTKNVQKCRMDSFFINELSHSLIAVRFHPRGTVQIITLVFTGEPDSQSLGEGSSSYTFDYAAIFLSSTAELVGVTITMLLIDRTGRVATQSVLYVVGGLMVFGMCWLAGTSNNPTGSFAGENRVPLIVLAFFARMCVMGGAQLTWIITAEILPTQIRTTGHAMASAVARVGGASMPWLASTDNSFQLMAIVMACIGVYTASMVCMLPETAGRSMGTARMMSSGSYDTNGNPLKVSEIL